MNAKLEDFNDKYVVVPNFKAGGFGFMTAILLALTGLPETQEN